jgi:hypothetical protein
MQRARPAARTASIGYREERSAPIGYHEERTASIGYREERAASIGYHEERTASIGYREERSASIGYREERTAPIGYREERAASIGYREETLDQAAADYTQMAMQEEAAYAERRNQQERISEEAYRHEQQLLDAEELEALEEKKRKREEQHREVMQRFEALRRTELQEERRLDEQRRREVEVIRRDIREHARKLKEQTQQYQDRRLAEEAMDRYYQEQVSGDSPGRDIERRIVEEMPLGSAHSASGSGPSIPTAREYVGETTIYTHPPEDLPGAYSRGPSAEPPIDIDPTYSPPTASPPSGGRRDSYGFSRDGPSMSPEERSRAPQSPAASGYLRGEETSASSSRYDLM